MVGSLNSEVFTFTDGNILLCKIKSFIILCREKTARLLLKLYPVYPIFFSLNSPHTKQADDLLISLFCKTTRQRGNRHTGHCAEKCTAQQRGLRMTTKEDTKLFGIKTERIWWRIINSFPCSWKRSGSHERVSSATPDSRIKRREKAGVSHAGTLGCSSC